MNRRILVAGLAAASLALAGCSSTVAGVAAPDSSAALVGTTAPIEAPLSSMLLTPADFPAPYEAIVLPAQAVSQAAGDLSGFPAGAKVDPAGCKPPSQDYGENGTAMIVGTDNAQRATISVELMRTATPLSVRAQEIGRCSEVVTTKNGAQATVKTTVVPAPPLNADDTLALRQTVTSGEGAETVTQSTLTLLAQVRDVRVSATYMSFGTGAPDSAALDQVFTEAVQRVNAAA
ncbi:sensor domain-containing protein [Rhodococcus kronopolitis]|uniref:Sensor domain-containing protein n=1 Tax=Rhodococcus kronopolitis TaxID=1460226 RepID=A0ABV9FQR8_9NOCA